MDAVGKHRTSSVSQLAVLEDIVGGPLDAMGITIADVATYATELHDPEVTEPAGGGDVADRNYKMLAGLGVVRGELTKDGMAGFARDARAPGLLADAGPHRLGDARGSRTPSPVSAPVSSTARCCSPKAACSSGA